MVLEIPLAADVILPVGDAEMALEGSFALECQQTDGTFERLGVGVVSLVLGQSGGIVERSHANIADEVGLDLISWGEIWNDNLR